MFKFALVTLALLGSALAYPVDIFEDETGQQYAVVPIENQQHRVRRDCGGKTDYGYDTKGAHVSHTQTLINNDRHKVDASAFAQRQFHPKGPLTTGQGVDYTYKPSDSTLSISTTNTRGQGTDLSATGQYNFLKSADGKAQLGAYGQYNRHYNGPQGTQHPQTEFGLRGTVNFD